MRQLVSPVGDKSWLPLAGWLVRAPRAWRGLDACVPFPSPPFVAECRWQVAEFHLPIIVKFLWSKAIYFHSFVGAFCSF